jgi:phospholipase/lecithinase/hemolysin
MADLTTMPRPVLEMLEQMSRLLANRSEGTVVVPSLLRHFGSQPQVLALMWVAALPNLGPQLVEAAVNTGLRARKLASMLPFSIPRSADATIRSALERFSTTVATMVVAGALLKATLFPAASQGRKA